MAAVARVEFANAGAGAVRDGVNENIIERMVGTATLLDVSGTATAGASRPVAPDALDLVVIVTVTSGNVIAAVGADPTATQTNGKVALEGQDIYLSIRPGEKVSLVELDLT
jgi:hypothetical protein